MPIPEEAPVTNTDLIVPRNLRFLIEIAYLKYGQRSGVNPAKIGMYCQSLIFATASRVLSVGVNGNERILKLFGAPCRASNLSQP